MSDVYKEEMVVQWFDSLLRDFAPVKVLNKTAWGCVCVLCVCVCKDRWIHKPPPPLMTDSERETESMAVVVYVIGREIDPPDVIM